MAKITFVPWYVADWLADTAELDPIEYWIYHRLLMQIYKESTFVERSYIERITKVLRDEDKDKIEWVLSTFFYEVKEGEKVGYMNKRAKAEMEKIAEKSEKARKSVMSRYSTNVERTKNERNTNVDRTNYERSTINNQIKEDIYTPLPPNDSEQPERKPRRKNPDAAQDAERPDDVSEEAWVAWMQIRKDKGVKHFSVYALKLLRKECEKKGITLQTAIETCISRNWASYRVEYQDTPTNRNSARFERSDEDNPFLVKNLKPRKRDEDEDLEVLAAIRAGMKG
jgi:uncharacterized protein YdaU (DUF1376 family)